VFGRFVSEDPIGLVGGGVNFYQYVLDNPVSGIDPGGLQYAQSWAVAGATAGVIVTAAGSVVADAATGGVNVVATPAELVLGGAAGGLIGYELGRALDYVVHFNPASPGVFPDPLNPPADWVPHPTGKPDTWKDPDGDTWHWHDEPGHGVEHWDIGFGKASPSYPERWWWPRDSLDPNRRVGKDPSGAPSGFGSVFPVESRQIMVKGFLCDEITSSVVEMKRPKAETLFGFFQFGRYGRRFSDNTALRDCHIYSLRPDLAMSEWSVKSGMPDPGIFQEVFPDLVSRLVEPNYDLYLHVNALEPEYFDELSVLKEKIVPMGSQYMLLSTIANQNTQLAVGNLIFGCPLSFLSYVSDNWFYSPITEVEGYIMRREQFGELAEHYFKADSAETIRGVLSTLRLGFRLWPDFNGMEILSDKVRPDSLQSLLNC
jgi:hypothetical protein